MNRLSLTISIEHLSLCVCHKNSILLLVRLIFIRMVFCLVLLRKTKKKGVITAKYGVAVWRASNVFVFNCIIKFMCCIGVSIGVF